MKNGGRSLRASAPRLDAPARRRTGEPGNGGAAGCGGEAGARRAGGRAGAGASAGGGSAACRLTRPTVAGFHVTTGGSKGGDGSAAAPWDLPTALAAPAAVKPGDTIWVHGGTYKVALGISNLAGTDGAPVTVRAVP